MKTRWKVALALTGLSVAVVTAGCSKDGERGASPSAGASASPVSSSGQPAGDKVTSEPLTLSFLQTSAKMTDDEFKKWVADPVKKKFPNITMTLVREDTPDNLTKMVAAENLPDVIYAGPVTAAKLMELQAAQDLTDAIKRNSVDLGKFDPTGINIAKQLSDTGKMYALPFGINFAVLYYNKDIFDRFAVPYPKDGMLWDDAIELAKKLTRTDGGVQYKGLAIDGNINRLGEQLGIPTVDAKTSRSALQTDSWKAVFETYQKIGQIPGNWLDNPQRIPAFEKDRNLAMFAGLSARIGELEQLQQQGQPINWDMVTLPAFKQSPKDSFGGGIFYLMTSAKSKHPAEAFQVIKLLTDDDIQTMISQDGRRSALKDPKYGQIFGQTLNTLKGKNKDAIFKMNQAPQPPVTIYDDAAFKELVAAGNQIAKEAGTDVNTVLRETDEKINKAIDALKQK